MARNTPVEFQSVHSEGGLLPPDLLRKVVALRSGLPGLSPEDYGLPPGDRLNEAITQSWQRLQRHWVDFHKAAKNLGSDEPGTGLTNDKWSVPLLRELGFGLIPTSPMPTLEGRSYAHNRFFASTAIHLVGKNVSLDRRAAGVRGAASSNPHGLVQEFLNRSPSHLWAIVSNGLRFRVLRDNQALSRQSYLEFDLEAMFTGEVYSDFVLLWLMAHATRFTERTEGRPESCRLEQWTHIAEADGSRALGDLRKGVETALQILGEAFVSHPRNSTLREALRTEQLTLSSFHAQLLRLVYRLIFLFVAEDRTIDGASLLHAPDDSEAAQQARQRYRAHYGTARLRALAGKIKGSRHGDLWQQFNLLVGALSGDARFQSVRTQLALPALGSFLWNPGSTPHLNAANLENGQDASHGVELANADFLAALKQLAYTEQNKMLRPVDYKNLGAEELGGVYESLLALTPQISGDGARFTFAEFAGNERKTSGSYYTPDSLVQCLLDSALDPVVAHALQGKVGVDAEQAILNLKVCDPAVGSGHFLVGAAHRLARHLSRVRANIQGESEPSPLLYQHALRDVIGRCLYGVDINPISAELCRVSLWLEALEPGKPLSFLDHHIQVGNSLLGTTPALMAQGIPDAAFEPIEGDDKKVCSELKKRNKQERDKGQRTFEFGDDTPEFLHTDKVAEQAIRVSLLPDQTAAQVALKQHDYNELKKQIQPLRELANAWCAAFVIPKVKSGPLEPRVEITHDIFRQMRENPHKTPWGTRQEIEKLAEQYQFFHWHLAFPEVFQQGGFDCVLGNPPWERVKIQEKEWFAERVPSIATASNAAVRGMMIKSLATDNPSLFAEFGRDLRTAEGASSYMRTSGRYPLCGRGDVNLYTVFAEQMRACLAEKGRVGCIVPSGVSTDDTTKFFFQDLIDSRKLVSFYSFENEEFLFPGVHHSTKFCLLTATAIEQTQSSTDFVFFARSLAQLAEPNRHFTLTANDIKLLNPNTRTCPIFRSKADAELNKAIYRRVPVLIEEGPPEQNPWGVSFLRMLDMANDSGLFRDQEQLEAEGWRLQGNQFVRGDAVYLPLYEAKMVHYFDHRFGTYEGQTEAQSNQGKLPEFDAQQHADPQCFVIPRYWLDSTFVIHKTQDRYKSKWFFFLRDICRNTDSRTAIGSLVSFSAIAGGNVVLCENFASPLHVLTACMSSFAFD